LKKLSVFALLLIIMTLFFGCGQNNENASGIASASAEPSAAASDIEIATQDNPVTAENGQDKNTQGVSGEEKSNTDEVSDTLNDLDSLLNSLDYVGADDLQIPNN
jgi:hypothetical protein